VPVDHVGQPRHLIPGEDAPERVAGVVIGDRTVDWVGPVSALPVEYSPLRRTDYSDFTIMPGLIDSHVHLAFDGGPNPAARMRAETDEQQLVLMLHSARELLGIGVTTARDLGARGYLAVAVRDAIATGLARGPRLVVAACPITVTGGHCWFMGGEAGGRFDVSAPGSPYAPPDDPLDQRLVTEATRRRNPAQPGRRPP
jgi:imidazolonepropionase-like amidohydrolase